MNPITSLSKILSIAALTHGFFLPSHSPFLTPAFRPTTTKTSPHNPRFSTSSSQSTTTTTTNNTTFQILQSTKVLSSQTSTPTPILSSINTPLALIIILPQLGEFTSTEYTEQLLGVLPDLHRANITLRIIGIGSIHSARTFSNFTNCPLEHLFVDPNATIHTALEFSKGPDWKNIPNLFPYANAWVNYMAMCMGISSPGTLREILRGYVGDKTAPERLREGDVIRAGFIRINDTRRVQIGDFFEYDNFWKNQTGYQRPVELATVRLKGMVEVLTKWEEYVDDARFLAVRGGTFLVDLEDDKVVYEYKDRGVLTYSETMNRPLMFLRGYIGDVALNPLRLGDTGGV